MEEKEEREGGEGEGGGEGADKGARAQATGVPHRAPCRSAAQSCGNRADD